MTSASDLGLSEFTVGNHAFCLLIWALFSLLFFPFFSPPSGLEASMVDGVGTGWGRTLIP